ncbi:hypothetical protein H2200_009113 [Cladophialophora chaetospira]|uniref:Uncharacterized protein n=1 Tax=Cladophialophora chaetospira TaxID=386627 RepID=A0AA38X3H0_9EURO|nr:hypothetical protein H2200_009113 [Cladophialophora chaetospira]
MEEHPETTLSELGWTGHSRHQVGGNAESEALQRDADNLAEGDQGLPRISSDSENDARQSFQQRNQPSEGNPRPVSPVSAIDMPSEQDVTADASNPEGSTSNSSNRDSAPVEDGPERSKARAAIQKRTSLHGSQPVHTRIGIYTLVLAVLSIVFIIAALGFVGWLWFGNRSSTTWRRIMLDDFSKQAVTISAIVLRTALGILAGIATAMVASIALERRGVPFQDVAQVSIARFSNSGPDAFWMSILFRKTFIELPLRILLLLLLLTTLASQFTSTILLSDLGPGTVISPSITSTNTSGFSYANEEWDGNSEQVQNPNSPFFASPNYWTTDPTVFPAFAEYSEAGYSSDKTVDTGLTLRAFLPFGDASARQQVRDFQGMAPVFDTRVVCTRPQFTSLKADYMSRSWLRGNISAEASLPGLAATQPVVEFECPLVDNLTYLNGSARDPGNYWTICPMNASVGGLLPVLDPSNNSSLKLSFSLNAAGGAQAKVFTSEGQWSVADGGWAVDIGRAYLIHNATTDGGIPASNATTNWTSIPAEAPWANVNFQTLTDILPGDLNDLGPDCIPSDCWKTKFLISLCYDALPMPVTYEHIQEFKVTASASASRVEPFLKYDLKKRLFPTDSIRTQLGATSSPGSSDSRGILSLTSAQEILAEVDKLRNYWSGNLPEGTPNTPTDPWNVFNRTTYPWITPMAFYSLTNLAMCLGCNTDPSSDYPQASTILSTLFSDTIAATNSPALALQAVLTSVLRMAYYAFLPTFDAQSEVTVTSFSAAQVPLRTRGFWAVFGITTGHFVLCVMALIGFIAFTQVSSLKNAWQTVAHVTENTETMQILKTVGDKDDGEVAKGIEADENLRTRRFKVSAKVSSPEECD